LSAVWQTNVVFVTNAYDLRVQQATAGVSSHRTRYATFAGDAKAVNDNVAAAASRRSAAVRS